MKSFRKYVEECKEIENISEAEFNSGWWNSKSDTFKKRYIQTQFTLRSLVVVN